MIYQRRMPSQELFSAELELLMQNGRLAMVIIHLVGVAATVMMFWPFGPREVLVWGAGFLGLLLVRSWHMSRALAERRYRTAPRALYWQLLLGAMLTGSVWAGVYIYAAQHVSLTLQYVYLLLLISMAAFSIGFSVIVREYFLAHVFTSLWPVAWWSTVHYWQQPYNLLIGVSLLAYCAVLVLVCNQAHKSYRSMIALNWEREQTAKELGDITGSLRLRNRELQSARAQLTNLANVDELTGLGNRRLANQVLRNEINRSRRGGGALSLIMLDVDHFKLYNDNYGHPAGDEVLRILSRLMERACSRSGEVVARYGGEEFLFILPGASAESAQQTAKRLRDLVAEENIGHEFSPVAPRITVSQGVITTRVVGELGPEVLIKHADSALYRAKAAGRNAIECQ